MVTPGGAWNVSTGRPFSATAMKSCQIGPATWAPVSLLPIVVGLSKPTHTVVTRSGVKPENQASVKSCVVPVLPAIGWPSPSTTFAPVPRVVTPCIMVISWNTDAAIGDLLALIGQHRRGARVRARVAGDRRRPPDHVAVRILHAVDQRRDHLVAAHGQRGIGAGLAQHRRLHGAQRRGQHARHRFHLMEGDRVVGDRLHPDGLRHVQRHQVQRLLQRDAQRRRAAEIHLEVVRPPAARRGVHRRSAHRGSVGWARSPSPARSGRRTA